MKILVSVSLLGLIATTVSTHAAVIDLGPWTVVQYEFNDQPNANWVLSNGNTVATQTVNADASILLSNFELTNTVIDGSWQVTTTDDDDFMGFVFGYQGRGQYYLFDWKQGSQNDPLGLAEQGMSIKLVNVPGGADPTSADLWPTSGSARVTSLFHNTVSWADNTLYAFHLEFHPGQFAIEVRQGANTLFSQSFSDSTFTTGKFGFYNYSQGPVQYQGFTLTPGVPEPATSWLLVAGLAGYALRAAAKKRVTIPHPAGA